MQIATTVETNDRGPDAGALVTTVNIIFSLDERRELFGRQVAKVRVWYHQLPEDAPESDWTHGDIWLDQPIEDGRKEFPFYEGMPVWLDELTAEHSPVERYGRKIRRAIDLPPPGQE